MNEKIEQFFEILLLESSLERKLKQQCLELYTEIKNKTPLVISTCENCDKTQSKHIVNIINIDQINVSNDSKLNVESIGSLQKPVTSNLCEETTKFKFNVNDRVVVVNENFFTCREIGTVVEIDEEYNKNETNKNETLYGVKLDLRQKILWFKEENIKLFSDFSSREQRLLSLQIKCVVRNMNSSSSYYGVYGIIEESLNMDTCYIQYENYPGCHTMERFENLKLAEDYPFDYNSIVKPKEKVYRDYY